MFKNVQKILKYYYQPIQIIEIIFIIEVVGM